jgi:hypothetical protein
VGISGARRGGYTFAHAVGLVAAHTGAGAGEVAADAVTSEPRLAVAGLVAHAARGSLRAASGAGTADTLLAGAGGAVAGAGAGLPWRASGRIGGKTNLRRRESAVGHAHGCVRPGRVGSG